MRDLALLYLGKDEQKIPEKIKNLLSALQKGSDLHLAQDQPPCVRIEGKLEPVGPPLTKAETEEIIAYLIGNDVLAGLYSSRTEIDRTISLQFSNTELRMRINVALYQGRPFLVARRLKSVEGNPKKLGIPDVFLQLLQMPHGLVLIVGATGSGKSTTLANSLAFILSKYPKRVITIEDPIEYIIPRGLGLITQREVGMDTESFAQALRAAMREDPDIILVGEMRDTETALAALAAAETGHLVLATLHARSITEATSRITGMFPPEAIPAVKYRFSRVFLGGMAQTLPKTLNENRCLAWEFLQIETEKEKEFLLDPQGERYLRQKMASNKWRMADVLASFVSKGIISHEEALRHLNRPEEKETILQA